MGHHRLRSDPSFPVPSLSIPPCEASRTVYFGKITRGKETASVRLESQCGPDKARSKRLPCGSRPPHDARNSIAPDRAEPTPGDQVPSVLRQCVHPTWKPFPHCSPSFTIPAGNMIHRQSPRPCEPTTGYELAIVDDQRGNHAVQSIPARSSVEAGPPVPVRRVVGSRTTPCCRVGGVRGCRPVQSFIGNAQPESIRRIGQQTANRESVKLPAGCRPVFGREDIHGVPRAVPTRVIAELDMGCCPRRAVIPGGSPDERNGRRVRSKRAKVGNRTGRGLVLGLRRRSAVIRAAQQG